MKKLAGIIALFLTLLAASSCKSRKAEFNEVKDDSLTVQVLKIRNADEEGTIDLRVRIFPAHGLAEKSGKSTEEMWYATDSCFVLSTGGKELIPVMQQPVANGMKNSFEYLLLFEGAEVLDSRDMKLVYRDRHFTGKTYTMSLKSNN